MSRVSAHLHFALRAVAVLAVATATAVADDKKEGDKNDGNRPPVKPAELRKERQQALEQVSEEQFGRLDRNADGILRGTEVPEGWQERFDRNGDGAVSRGEFTEINERPAKLRRLHPLRDARARAADTTRTFDRNADGVIQREEYPGRDDVFRRADRSRNGALEAGEVLALCEEQVEDIRKRLRSPARNEFLDLFDADRDRRVDQDEYDGPAAAFRKFDTDGDGTVTYDELYPEQMREMRDAGPKPERLTAIAALDKDDDGRVARSEFPGSDAAWRRLDRNGDGFVTAADSR